MTQKLHLVLGGELANPTEMVFKDAKEIDLVGIFANYEDAYDAWKDNAHKTVDNAHARYFIAHIHRLVEEDKAESSTEKLG